MDDTVIIAMLPLGAVHKLCDPKKPLDMHSECQGHICCVRFLTSAPAPPLRIATGMIFMIVPEFLPAAALSSLANEVSLFTIGKLLLSLPYCHYSVHQETGEM